MMNNSTEDNARWYVIYTKPNDQERADYNLRAWGVETFNPKMRQVRYNEFTDKPTYTTKPLFPRYLFARFDADLLLHKIYFTRGVSTVVNFGEGPVTVEDEIIELMRSQVGADGMVKPANELKTGDQVMIKEGPLKNLVGLFEGHGKEADRVKVLLTTLNYQGSIVIEREFLKKVG